MTCCCWIGRPANPECPEHGAARRPSVTRAELDMVLQEVVDAALAYAVPNDAALSIAVYGEQSAPETLAAVEAGWNRLAKARQHMQALLDQVIPCA